MIFKPRVGVLRSYTVHPDERRARRRTRDTVTRSTRTSQDTRNRTYLVGVVLAVQPYRHAPRRAPSPPAVHTVRLERERESRPRERETHIHAHIPHAPAYSVSVGRSARDTIRRPSDSCAPADQMRSARTRRTVARPSESEHAPARQPQAWAAAALSASLLLTSSPPSRPPRPWSARR